MATWTKDGARAAVVAQAGAAAAARVEFAGALADPGRACPYVAGTAWAALWEHGRAATEAVQRGEAAAAP